MRKIIESTMQRSTLIILTVLMISVWGIASAFQMQKDYLPSINNTTLMVTVRAPSYSAEQARQKIALPMEQTVRMADGLTHVETNSFDGGLTMSLYFPMDFDMKKAETEINRLLGNAALPNDIDGPLVSRMTTSSFPILTYSITSDSKEISDLDLQTTVQTEIAQQIQTIPGVKEVRTVGGGKKGYVLLIRTKDLAKYNLTLNDVYQSLGTNLPISASGNVLVDTMAIPLNVTSWNPTKDDIQNTKITNRLGTEIPLSKIGELTPSVTDTGTVSRTNGKTSVVLNVLKTPSSNITTVSKAVNDKINNLDLIKNGDVHLNLLLDKSKDLSESLNGLLREGILGSIFSMLCVFLFFRRVRSTLVIALSLPISLLVTVSFLKMLGITLNILTVSGLVVAMGRIVDDSIVVLDNMYRKVKDADGKMSLEILSAGASEMMPAIFASTATTIAVYLPIALVGGYVTASFSGFALSVVISLIVSFFVALLVIPTLTYMGWNYKEDKSIDLEPRMRPILEKIFNKKKTVLGITTLLLVSAVLFGLTLPVNLLPTAKTGQVSIQLELPKNSPIDKVDTEVAKVEDLLATKDNVKHFSTAFGASFTPEGDDVFDQGGGFIMQPNIANISVELKDKHNVDEFINRTNKEVKQLSNDVVYTVSNQNTTGDDSLINISLSGADQETLAGSAKQVKKELIKIEDLSVIGTADVQNPIQQLSVKLDKDKIRSLNIDTSEVNKVLYRYLTVPQDFELNIDQQILNVDTHIDGIHTTKNDSNTSTVEELYQSLRNESFKGKNGEVYKLDEFATIEKVTGQKNISMRDGEPFATVKVQITGNDIGKVSKEVKQSMENVKLPDGVTYSLGGITEQVKQMIINMAVALSFSILLILIITSAVFKGWKAPFSVIISIPLALTGVVLSMFLFHSQWNLAALIGVLMLTGIVVTNGIVLIDKIERNINSGMERKEAILSGSLSRVRPIFVTAATTVLTLLPLAFSTNADTVISKTLGIVVIGGMVTSTLNSFIVIPIIYEWFVSKKKFKRFGVKTSKSHASRGS
ncbi:efflux RND transporter permease subunit [Pseudalkalibacillus caeni]|uniref:Efflux RND transporter permease subunit n=1 Tax=Exobacillus caeni TaxID=2574798 RepID=A0A5R9F495_9BACL|nr:efflux RND transporter permease subunit [Pseudalkalibacillus caeni]TLS36448.1 efflux RND transporter permease subunit [Pseudalkalibacillus caeni]